MKWHSIFFWRTSLAVIILLLGISLLGFRSWKVDLLNIIFSAIPLACQLFSHRLVQVYGLWFGMLLIMQTAISPLIIDKYYKTLPRNVSIIIDIQGKAFRNIQGIQHLNTDWKGYRVTPSIEYESKKGIRIIAIGGSTTADILLDDKHIWTYLLQEKLKIELGRPVEVINTGVSGVRAAHHLATFSRTLQYEPDFVLFLVGVNDWVRHIWKQFDFLPWLHDGIFGLVFEDTMLGVFSMSIYDRVKLTIAKTKEQFVKGQDIRLVTGELFGRKRGSLGRKTKFEYFPQDVSEEYKKYIMRISDLCDNANISCIFVTQPSGYHFDSEEKYKESFWLTPPDRSYTLTFKSMVAIADVYNKYLTKFGKKRGHKVCDIARFVPPSFESFYDDVHYNTRGAKKVAELISKCVIELVRKECSNWARSKFRAGLNGGEASAAEKKCANRAAVSSKGGGRAKRDRPLAVGQ